MIPKLLTTIILTTISAVQALKPPLPHRLIASFPFPSWIENIAVRSNGDLLLTQISSTSNATLYSIPSPSSPSPTPIPIHTFPNTTYLLGIAESSTTPDLFVLISGNPPSATSPAVYLLWTIDFRPPGPPGPPKITLLTQLELTNASLPNGLTPLPHRNAVLMSDSFAGVTWHIDLSTGITSLAVQVPEMAPPPPSTPGTTAVGINGIKISKGYLYWTNSALATIYRVRIDAEGRKVANAKVEIVAKVPDVAFLDDFAIGEDGVIWVATNTGNSLVAVREGTGESVVVVGGGGGDLAVMGDTAVAFGRGRDDRCVLYVVTFGGYKAQIIEGAKVVAVDTRGFGLR